MIKLEVTFYDAAEMMKFLSGDHSPPERNEKDPGPIVQGGAEPPAPKRGPGRPRKADVPPAPTAAEVKTAPVTVTVTKAEIDASLPKPPPSVKVLPEAPEEAPVEDTEPLETTFEDYKTAFQSAMTTGNRGIVKEVLAEFGAIKLSDVPAEKWADAIKQLQERLP